MNFARFGFFQVRARTSMDLNKWVIFAYDRVPARDFGLSRPIRTVLMLPNPSPTPSSPRDIEEKVCKSHLKATIKADISRSETYRRNEAKALDIPLEEFEHNNCSA